MGLIQREIERKGIPTVGISIVREYSQKVKPPRTIFLKWPFGHPLGDPFHTVQQRTVLAHAFRALYGIHEPGAIIDIPLKWKKGKYRDKDPGILLRQGLK